MNGKTLAKKIKGSVTGWLFLLPMTFGICVFTLLPIVQSLWYSFYDYEVVSKFDFVGIGNYAKAFRDPAMGKVVGNTLLFAAVNIPVVLVGSYLLALLLNVDLKGVKTFRVIYYLRRRDRLAGAIQKHSETAIRGGFDRRGGKGDILFQNHVAAFHADDFLQPDNNVHRYVAVQRNAHVCSQSGFRLRKLGIYVRFENLRRSVPSL